MRTIRKKILLIIPIVFSLIFLAGCPSKSSDVVKRTFDGEFANDLNVYNDSEIIENNIHVYSKADIDGVDYGILTISFEVTISNNNSNAVDLTLEEPVAYGNDMKLEEKVLEYYGGSSDPSTLYKGEVIHLNSYKKGPNKNYYNYLNFYLVIKEGNSKCKYRVDFKLNNVVISFHAYKSDYELSNFLYVHNPSRLRSVLADAERDTSAVFGYKPNSTGSLKLYADYDWTNPDFVNEAKENRIAYISENDEKIKALENELREQDKSIEEIARACSQLRNQIRLDQYKDDPDGLATLKQRNLEKYGHEEGPLPDELYEKYNSWETVLEKCYSVNRGMDACCGVYDMFYYLYNDFAYTLED